MARHPLIHESLTAAVIGAFFDVYNELGPGLPEHVHVLALERELVSRGHRVEREVSVPVFYKGRELMTFRIDMLVDGCLVVEAKATDALHPSALRQLYTYLKVTAYEVGLLLHFGPEAKFYRVVSFNEQKRHAEPRSG